VNGEADMWFIGKLSRDKQGVGSIVGAVFMLLILLTGFTHYIVNVNVTEIYNEVLQDMGELDLKRNKENIEFISVTFNDDTLNITAKNSGSYNTHLIWLGIFDETSSPTTTQEYYKIDFYVNPAETVANILNVTIPTFEGQERVIQLVTELGNTFTYSYPEEENTSIYDFVDNNTSNIDESDPSDKGTHVFFSAQKAGPDGIYDNLTEANTGTGLTNTTLINQESFEDDWPPLLPSVWSATGRWNKESNEAYDEDNSADFDGGNGQAGDLTTCDLDCSDAEAIYLDFWYRENDAEANEFLLKYFNGADWNDIYDLGSSESEDEWLHYQDKITDSQYFKSTFKIRWTADTNENNDDCWVDFVTVKKEASPINYELDLEAQWTSVDYDEDNEWLSIFCAEMGNEPLLVDVWNSSGNDWQEDVLTLSEGWNSIDVSSYLVSSTFTIRFRGGTETADTNQDTWEIDTTFLYLWTDEP